MRYAIYFAPAPATAFHVMGSQWVGRDAVSGDDLAQPALDGIADVTGEARRYGFHATLKPPFALREAVTAEELLQAATRLAAGRRAFSITLKVEVLDGFLALVPRETSDELQRLADDAVRDLDHLRRPPAADELARRRAARLSPRQDRHLLDWGYPYVFEDFRFHMTLTGRLPPSDAARFKTAAEAHFAAVLAAPVAIDGLSLFEEASPGAPFIATRRFPFSSSSAEVAA